MNRGVEIASDVADGPRQVILQQVTNGVAVRMAVCYLFAGGVTQALEESERSVAGAPPERVAKPAGQEEGRDREGDGPRRLHATRS
jgi:hypothetical protein